MQVRGEGEADADSYKATQVPTGREVETPFKESRARLPQVAFNVAEKYNFYLIYLCILGLQFSTVNTHFLNLVL